MVHQGRDQQGLNTRVIVALWFAMAALVAHAPVAEAGGAHRRVVVVGGGLAGLSAVRELIASDEVREVVLVEKEARVGGNSAKATSGINGVGSKAQVDQQVSDSTDSFKQDTVKAGRGLCDEALVDILVQDSKAAIEFVEKAGIELSVLSQLGGHTQRRTHREPNQPDGRPRPIGFDIIKASKEEVLSSPKLVVRTSCTMLDFVYSSGNGVTGIQVLNQQAGTKEILLADAVVLATGGYSADREGLLKQYAPQLGGLPTTNGAWAQGDGVKAATQIGAKTTLLEKVQVHPTGFVDPKVPDAQTKFLAPEALRGSGAVLLNRYGQRFCNELAPRDVVSGCVWQRSAITQVVPDMTGGEAELLAQAPRAAEAFLVMDDRAVELFGSSAFGFYKNVKKFFTQSDSYAGLAMYMTAMNQQQDLDIEVDEGVVRSTFEAYKKAADGELSDEFGRTTFQTNFEDAMGGEAAFYIARITPSLHYSMGGLAITPKAQVLNESGQPIPNLFGAGEVTGGVHGGNRLGGNSLLECVVFGRVAARSVIELFASNGDPHEEL
eukprot:m.359436 g.359436  ORF g.359436 m.359436 type:complete len:550 (+) comp18565_c0_seq1:294-1943(+)